MDSDSVFFEEWLRSLREQYKHVVRSGDAVTLPTLTAVLENLGFGEDELAQLRLDATMRVDDTADDFVAGFADILDPLLKRRIRPSVCVQNVCRSTKPGTMPTASQ